MSQIQEILNAGWPQEVDILGAATVRHIVHGVENGIPPSELFHAEEGGGELTFHEIVIDMIAAGTVAKNAVEIIKILMKADGKMPSASTVETELTKRRLGVAKEVIQKVIAALKGLGGIA